MTDAQLTQEALEQWAMPNASAQVTQLAAEEWGNVTAINCLAVLTQMALEVWTNAPITVIVVPMQTGVAINTG